MFSKWFRQGEQEPLYLLKTASDFSLPFDKQHLLPIPDWANCDPDTPADHQAAHVHWCHVAASWLARLGGEFSEPLILRESEHFFALSALMQRETEVLLDYAERTRKRVLSTLAGIASAEGFGKDIVMVLPSPDISCNSRIGLKFSRSGYFGRRKRCPRLAHMAGGPANAA
jgi:hypothetical protein